MGKRSDVIMMMSLKWRHNCMIF